jgi:Trehalase.
MLHSVFRHVVTRVQFKPTSKSSKEVLADFNNITSNSTEGQVVNFVNTDFRGEGLELQALSLAKFNPDPAFLKNISDPVLKAWSKIVHGYWTQLIRGTNSSALCNGGSCESSLIPLNHTFVVPGV